MKTQQRDLYEVFLFSFKTDIPLLLYCFHPLSTASIRETAAQMSPLIQLDSFLSRGIHKNMKKGFAETERLIKEVHRVLAEYDL